MLQTIELVRAAGKLVSGTKLKCVFISTDSTYDASGFLLDSHTHKFIPQAFLKATPNQEKPKLPKNNRTEMYAYAYGTVI